MAKATLELEVSGGYKKKCGSSEKGENSLLLIDQSSKRHGQDDVISCQFSVERSVRITVIVESVAEDKDGK